MEIIRYLFGEGAQLTALQMSCRMIVIFFLALLMIRIAGRRTFGKKTAFDNVIAITLGAVLARAVVGASPFWSTIAAGFILVILHRILARLSIRYKWLARLLEGESRLLYSNREIHWNEMRRSALNENDLMEGVRLQGNVDSLEEISEIRQETNGEISVIKRS